MIKTCCCTHKVYHALVVNRIAFSLSACGWLLSSDSTGRLNALFKRCGSTDMVYDVIILREYAIIIIFSKILSGNLLPSYVLPPR